MRLRVFLAAIFIMANVSLLSQQAVEQDATFITKVLPRFYTYTPVTDTAINITTNSATLIGDDGRAKSNKTDTLATKKAPYRYITWWSDDVNLITNGDFTTDLSGWTVESGTAYQSGGNLVFESGLVSQECLVIGATYTVSVEVIASDVGQRLAMHNGLQLNLINTGIVGTHSKTFTATSPILVFAGGNTVTADNFTCSVSTNEPDSTSGKTVNLLNLVPELTYNYYYSMFVRAVDGDIDYYKGETKTFTTSALPEGELLRTEDLIYVVTEDGYYIQFEGE